MFGKSSEALLGSSFTPLIHEDDLHNTLEAMELLKTPPYRCYVEQRAMTVYGWRWLAWEDCAIIDEDGKIVEIQAVGRDITDIKNNHDALADSEMRLRTLISNVTGAVYRTVYNDGWKIQFISDAIEMISGYPVEYFTGNTVEVHTELIHPDDRCMVENAFRRLIQVREPYVVEYRIRHADGSLRWILDKGQVIYSDSGAISSLDGILSDITAIKLSEEKLRKSYNIQREFLNNISHEVRTPLTAVQGYVRMLMEGTMGSVSEEQSVLLKKVLVNSDHLLSIVNGVLEIARTKSGSLHTHPKACNPCVIVDTAVSSIIPQATLKGLAVNVDKPSAQQVAMYDEQKLIIILTNLLTNAVKFTETGSIDIKLSYDSQGIEIIVSDTGPGIDPDNLDSIFEEFTQLDYPKKHKPTGFGIGLAIVATMLESIQGELTVSSTSNVGTAFTLRAPKL
jgi:PAS domain S-box-containing protein